ncbi:MAG: lipoyl(octanoyl) transferase LipB [Dysgonamonadaceae bacterium]
MPKEILFENWGLTDYQKAWDKQEKAFNEAIELKSVGKIPVNRLIFCEHPHVLTLGKHGDAHNLLYSDEFLNQKGVALYRTNRGGDVTYHGPGQIVGYPIFDLEQFGLGLKQYIHRMEEVIIRFLKIYGIESDRLEGATGVWLEKDTPSKARKICAIGVRSSRFVTMHGFALNINTDLSYFQLINPCGFVDKGVTSLEKELGHTLDMDVCRMQLKELFFELFGIE